ncbi:sodium:proton antiporter [Pseudomonas taeanensis MS-3]|jgi:NhaC family Na+:H+ antiporter|uniref:Sodium:proton antiporter n=1 Tax=Pseudomonas taeanensis MS-3 TaxID=1395571 RepID=A0A0A1YHN6_9PSED|nr:Na+/H+ antiporter NhaC [Pseudomonas taeanensis]KFX68488.1 sodium:proton antiporter [Pseudomonas taeanensis MS-3]
MKLRKLSALDALLVGAVLLALIAGSLSLFDDPMSGPLQLALIMVGCFAALIGMKNGVTWAELESEITATNAKTVAPIFIFLSIGVLIGAFIIAGTVPTLLYAGLSLLSPAFFYPLACLICAIVSMCIGSSWTTAATIGVGLMGTAHGFGLSAEITAGAVVAGAYFGDKMSPLSETTNLAPAVAGSELFAHIRHMAWVSLPSFLIALVLFSILALNADAQGEAVSNVGELKAQLAGSFNIAWYNLIPLLALLGLSVRKAPAFPAIMLCSALACVFAVLFQAPVIERFMADSEQSGALMVVKALWTVMATGFVSHSGNEVVDSLLSRGGMAGMVFMAFLVFCSMMMTAVLERIGFIRFLLGLIVRGVHSVGALIGATLATSIGVNVLTGDQYLSLVLPGQMWKEEYRLRGLAAVNLSRTIEDGGTVTSSLIPWNACGVYMAATLGVATLSYAPFAFFNWINPIIALIYGIFCIKILPLASQDDAPQAQSPTAKPLVGATS